MSVTPESVEVSLQTVRVTAQTRVRDVEAALQARGLSLGALPEWARDGLVGELVTGPLHGRRVTRGGLTEALWSELQAETAAGQRFTVHAEAGVRVSALLLEAEPPLLAVREVVLQALVPGEHETTLAFAFSEPAALVNALRDMLEDQVFIVAVEVKRLETQWGARVTLQGSRTALARDRSAVFGAARRYVGVEQNFSVADAEGPHRSADWPAVVSMLNECALGEHLWLTQVTRVQTQVQGIGLEVVKRGPVPDLRDAFDPQRLLEMAR